jgi:hypothetical protein
MPRIICEPSRPGSPHLPTREDWERWESDEPASGDEGIAGSTPDQNRTRREFGAHSTIGSKWIPILLRLRRRLTPPWTDSLV